MIAAFFPNPHLNLVHTWYCCFGPKLFWCKIKVVLVQKLFWSKSCHLHDRGQELFIKFKISFISVWNTQLWIPYWVLLSYGESRMDFHYNCCRSYNTVMVKFFWVPPETLPMWSYLRGGYFQVRVWHGQCSKTSHKL